MTTKTVLWRIETNETDSGEWETVDKGEATESLALHYLARYRAEVFDVELRLVIDIVL